MGKGVARHAHGGGDTAGAWQGHDGEAGVLSRLHQVGPRVGYRGRARIADVSDALPRLHEFDEGLGATDFVVLVQGDEAFVDAQVAHDISSYSFPALAKAARPMMRGRNGACLTLSYLGAVRAIPHYNVMGLAKASLEASVRFTAASLGRDNIRANGISAGPIKTLAASGISGFGKLLKMASDNSPLKRNVTIEEVGNTAAFLLSDLASGITGEITYVDAGYSINALNVPEEA